ncbi:hypothetical protein GQ457_07G003250 [Hibiscus cannabinus]
MKSCTAFLIGFVPPDTFLATARVIRPVLIGFWLCASVSPPDRHLTSVSVSPPVWHLVLIGPRVSPYGYSSGELYMEYGWRVD